MGHKSTAAFPTHAGMNRELTENEQLQYGVPHTRGDEPDEKLASSETGMRSPHTRG